MSAATPATDFFIKKHIRLSGIGGIEEIAKNITDIITEQHTKWVTQFKQSSKDDGVVLATVADWEAGEKFVKAYFHERYPATVKQVSKHKSETLKVGTVICNFVIQGAVAPDVLNAKSDALVEGDEIDKIHRRYTRKITTHDTPLPVFNYSIATHNTDPALSLTFCSFAVAFIVAK